MRINYFHGSRVVKTNRIISRGLTTIAAMLGILLLGTFTTPQQLPQIGNTGPPGSLQAYAVSNDGRLGVAGGADIVVQCLRSAKREFLQTWA